MKGGLSMDNTSTNSGINDDELNKMIANLQDGSAPSAQPTILAPTGVVSGVQTTQPASSLPISSDPVDLVSAPAAPDVAPSNLQDNTTVSFSAPSATSYAGISNSSSALDDIKGQALSELRPLVDKLNLAPEDKFDVLLLMIRSTDDSSLVSEAHAVAKQIQDDARRAQALLDIIKEIDFFDQNKTK